MNVNELILVFNEYYNHSNPRVFFVRGFNHEVEEITNFTSNQSFKRDYLFGTYILTAKTDTNRIRLVSLNFEEMGIIEISLNELDNEIKHDWSMYLKKTFFYLKEAGYCINQGMDIIIYGNVPNEVGLSSSRSIEALTGVIIKSLYE
jgi:galactokinase